MMFMDCDYYLDLYRIFDGKKYHSLDIFCIMLKMEICIMVARSMAQSIAAGAANQAWMALATTIQYHRYGLVCEGNPSLKVV